MDPHLEPHWLDVHSSLATSARDALNRQLPDDLVASVEERVAIEADVGTEHVYGPDVRVSEPGNAVTTVIEEPSGGVVAAPYRLVAQVEPVTERSVQITEAGTERLVTVIEFVSPTNKRGAGLQAFRDKRAHLLASGVNFVEIDLVRAGDWRALLGPHQCAPKAMSLYRAAVRVPADPAAVYLHPIRLQDPLPSIPLPLRRNDPEVRLDLQALVEHAYVSGRYDRRIDYAKPLAPPLPDPDAEWADQLLRSANRR
jgi:hypothetical protein